MVLLYFSTTECCEFPKAVEVEVTGTAVICRDEVGTEVARFNREEVTAYTSQGRMVELMREEVCEDGNDLGLQG
jgi:hypothetical protein